GPDPGRGGRPDADLTQLDPGAAAQRGRLDQVQDLPLGEPPQLGRVVGPVGVAGVGEQPGDLDPGHAGDPADQLGGGRAGRPAQPVQAGVDLDQDLDVTAEPGPDPAQALGALDRVQAHPHPGPLQQLAQAAQLVLADE